MQIIRTFFWVVIAIVLVLFAVANWQPVEVRIGGGLVLDTKLPVLVIAAFLLGLMPMWAVHRLSLWRLRRRMSQMASSQAYQVGTNAYEPDAAVHADRPLAS